MWCRKAKKGPVQGRFKHLKRNLSQGRVPKKIWHLMAFAIRRRIEKNLKGTRTPPPFMANAIKNFHFF